MTTIAEYTDRFGQEVEIDKLNSGKYCITVGGIMTQKDVTADGVIGWLANASNYHIPESLTLEVGKSYFTRTNRIVKISKEITEEDDRWAYEAGYRFRSEQGRAYTALGDHNDSDFCLIREARTA